MLGISIPSIPISTDNDSDKYILKHMWETKLSIPERMNGFDSLLWNHKKCHGRYHKIEWKKEAGIKRKMEVLRQGIVEMKEKDYSFQ